jgi:hypothetical protein
MTQDGTAKDDVKIPEGDIGKGIQAEFDDGKELVVTIIAAMGEEAVSDLSISRYMSILNRLLGHLLQRSSQG